MTTREFFNKVISGVIDEETKAYAASAIKKMDEQNEKRKSMPSKTAVANAPMKAAILSILEKEEHPITSSAFFASHPVDGVHTVNKVSSLLVDLLEEGKVVREKISVKGKGKQYAYSIAK